MHPRGDRTVPGSTDAASGDWYVIQTKPRQESRAEMNLRTQGFRCVLPTLRAERIRRGRRLLITEPLFARYLFIHLACGTQNWGPIHSTRGVSSLVAFGGVPAKLPPGCVEALLNDEREPVRLFQGGERVVVTSGPLRGLEGIYQIPDGETRAYVLLELLRKPCTGSFPLEALRRVA